MGHVTDLELSVEVLNECHAAQRPFHQCQMIGERFERQPNWCIEGTWRACGQKGGWSEAVAYPGIFFGWGSTNSVEDRGQRGRGSWGGSPLVRGSGGSCNLVQEISFHIVKFS